MRVPELIEQPNTKGRFLAMSDLELSKEFMPVKPGMEGEADRLDLSIRSSKTDPTGQGETHWFGRSKMNNGPVEAAILIKQVARKYNCNESEKFENIAHPPIGDFGITNMLNAHFTGLTTHAMRRGGTCHLVECGVSWTSTKVLGRWKSDAAPQLYTRNFNAMSIDRVKTISSGRVIKNNRQEEVEEN